MRHPFKPQAHDPSRCRYCLHKLDCAPHLPLTPRATYPEWRRARRRYSSTESRLHAERLREAHAAARAAVQGER